MNEDIILEDEKVSFNTAKLAKEKGFDITTTYYFDFIGDTCSGTTKTNWNKSKEDLYSKPTQALLQRWLREIHKIDIFITKVKNSYAPSVYSKNISKHAIGVTLFGKDKTYEEALELGLFEALNLIPIKI